MTETQQMPLLLSITEAGKLLGICRSAAYTAAQRGDLPTLRVNNRLRVPTPALARLLDASPPGQVSTIENVLSAP